MKMRFFRRVQPENRMSASTRKRPPVIRLPPRSNAERLLAVSAQLAAIAIGLVAVVVALQYGKFILEPVTLGVVLGLMFGPVATRIERCHVVPGLSALLIVLIFLVVVAVFAAALAAPLSFWIGRLPQIMHELQLHLSELREPLNAIRNMRDQLRGATGGHVTVQVDEGSPVESVAVLAPAVLAQILIFFASLYFFVATRHATRTAILKLCVNRRLRWRVAHIFRDTEHLVSRYLLSITVINICQGIAVTLALWIIGVPSPAMWGALAGLLNFIIYVGPALMALILLGVGVVTFDTLLASLMPPAAFLALHLTESQFVTPTVLGRTLTLNPFVIFLALAFWLWIWGPIGGFIAIPTLLILYAAANHILPGAPWLTDEDQPLTRRRSP
jgi:predicted PurR-regulated permease PerM